MNLESRFKSASEKPAPATGPSSNWWDKLTGAASDGAKKLSSVFGGGAGAPTGRRVTVYKNGQPFNVDESQKAAAIQQGYSEAP